MPIYINRWAKLGFYSRTIGLSSVNHHLSLGLNTIIGKMAKKGETVLDLGPLSTQITSLFLQLKCRCFIEDMHEYVLELNNDSSNPLDKLSAFLLDKPEGTTFDYVLCWDLFNFLSLDIINHLMALLKPYLKPGTILHTIRYIGTATPHLPRQFKRLDKLNFNVSESQSLLKGNNQITPQAHTTIMLLRSMPEFSLYDTALNQEGMMKDVAEYLLEYESITKGKLVKKRLNAQDVVSYFAQQSNNDAVDLLGLKKILSDSNTMRQLSVFETGPKSGRQVSYLNNLSKSLYIEDIYSSITWQNRLIGNQTGSVSQQLLKFPESLKFDLVLIWDIFNFCSPEQIKKIGELLSKHLNIGAKLHILIHKGKGIPKKPAVFEVTHKLGVNISGELKGDHPKNLRSITELIRLLPQFKLWFHHLGNASTRHDYQEFILEHKG